jgi:hypothetical protein
MNLTNTYVSRSDFRRALNLRCHKELGVGLSDLPDIIDLEDVWWEQMSEKEANQMLDGCIEDLKDELGYTPIHTVNAPIYSIDE